MGERSAIVVLVDRELRRYWRAKSRLISSVIQPLFYIVALGSGLSAAVILRDYPGTYLEFIIPGIIAMTVVTTSLFQGVSVIWDKTFGFMKEIMVAPVSRVSIAMGKALGSSIIATLNGLIVLVIGLGVGALAPSHTIILLVPGMLLIGLIFSSLGISLASVIEDMNAFQLLSNIIFMPMLFLSGIFYPLSSAPEVMQVIAYFNPMTYPVDFLRGSLTGVFFTGIVADIAVMGVSIVILLLLAAWLFSHTKVQI
ncbi:MAG: ABC transporter permease [Candidatus Korarchaeota archaeon]